MRVEAGMRANAGGGAYKQISSVGGTWGGFAGREMLVSSVSRGNGGCVKAGGNMCWGVAVRKATNEEDMQLSDSKAQPHGALSDVPGQKVEPVSCLRKCSRERNTLPLH